MGSGVDSAGKAGDNTEACLAEIACNPLRELDARTGGIARADNGDL